jgi:hypothetical protein
VVNGSTYWARIEPANISGTTDSAAAFTDVVVPAAAPSPRSAGNSTTDTLEAEAYQVAALLKDADPDHGGVAVDLAAGKVFRGLVDNADFTGQAAKTSTTAHPELVEARRMAYSTATLSALRDRIMNDRAGLADAGIHVRSTAVETLAGKVRVAVDTVTPDVVTTLGARYGSDAIIVTSRRTAATPDHNKPENSTVPRIPAQDENFGIYGGMEIISPPDQPLPTACTAGYVTKKSDGNFYLLTAGHCFPLGATVAVDNAPPFGGDTVIGTVVDQRDPGDTDGGDVETILLTFNNLASNQIIAGSTTELRNITDDADDFVAGTVVCVNPKSTDAERCATNDTVEDIALDGGGVVYHVADAYETAEATKTYVQEGDSGAGVYRSLSSTSLRVYGIMGGSSWHFDDDDILQSPTDGGFYYTFDQDIQDDFGTSVLTSPVS